MIWSFGPTKGHSEPLKASQGILRPGGTYRGKQHRAFRLRARCLSHFNGPVPLQSVRRVGQSLAAGAGVRFVHRVPPPLGADFRRRQQARIQNDRFLSGVLR